MKRCLQLAQLGIEDVAPNPMVGAVVVHNGQIIGEGYHRRYGEAHAEVNAIASVENKALLKESTIYVSLEPCSHYGKTPPCADLLIKHRIPRVVVGLQDPNPLVGGQGIERLRNAGAEVVVGVLEQECREVNKRFLCLQEKHRPYVILKWAQTADGFIDRLRTSADEPVLVISNPITKQLVHKMRAENMAIMVGTNTAILDNPSLRTTRWTGRNPLRVVIDKHDRIPRTNKLFTTSDAETLVLHTYDWQEILHTLAERKIHSLIVEGGQTLLNSIIADGTWDEAHVEIAPLEIGKGVEAPKINLPQNPTANILGHQIYSFKKH
ncbi:MAG: bifunctional diaminohydroxyphosphoribosylaminopyrimidine deaminase/5-amino-6-(5-phosphoribosylamino)uracil reductase RibD [Paludibacteraceae bacterium]|nr:bifunctional diaminohydroxyphosphoribosylaminopyrimidine deaminase/5-amino-6-(5-phosphoribosylamino)uracil reductase RibD [Paludibacteraceae bacterium]